VNTHTHTLYTDRRNEKGVHCIYTITCVEGLERDDDMPSKTISSGRKKDITSRNEKKETKKKERDRGACNKEIPYVSFIHNLEVH
jgi:hypothetical protein